MGQHSAKVEHCDVPAQFHHDFQMMLDKDDGQTRLFMKRPQEIDQIPRFIVVHPRSRFIQKQYFRLCCDGSRNLKSPLDAVWQLARIGIFVLQNAHLLQVSECVFMGFSIQTTLARCIENRLKHIVLRNAVYADLHIFIYFHFGKKADILESPADPAQRDFIRPHPLDALSIKHYGSRTGMYHTRNGIEQGRLACPVWADQTHKIACVHLEAHIVQRFQATELNGKVLHLQQSHFTVPPFWRQPFFLCIF